MVETARKDELGRQLNFNRPNKLLLTWIVPYATWRLVLFVMIPRKFFLEVECKR